MPLPLLPNLSDDDLFPLLNGCVFGYALLALTPRWRHTPRLTLALAVLYAVAYLLLLVHRLALSDAVLNPSDIEFDTLDGIARLFADRAALMAGWTHYIAFDLFVARHVLLDSQARGIPHLLVVPVFPLVLFVGPAGLAVYYCVLIPLHRAFCSSSSSSSSWILLQLSTIRSRFAARKCASIPSYDPLKRRTSTSSVISITGSVFE